MSRETPSQLELLLEDMLGYMRGHSHYIAPDSQQETGVVCDTKNESQYHTRFKNISTDDLLRDINNLPNTDELDEKIDLMIRTQAFILHELEEIKTKNNGNKRNT